MAATKLGDRIREAREARGMNKSQLAARVKVTVTAVWNWEVNGVTPRPPMLRAIAKALNVTEAYLLTGQQAPTHQTAADIIAEAAARIAALNGVPVTRVKIDWQIAQ
ncbi:MAG TPA: helix-turn-helix transcriptional regulator [Caulobacteraceae bacterium]|jgi:transcriptional regulator with XRE-family HTH domain